MADKFLESIKFSEAGDRYYPLPIIQSSDNGKVMMVQNGEWTMTELLNAEKEVY